MYKCKKCHRKSAIKHGYRYNVRGRLQKYYCKKCRAVFSGYGKITYRMKYSRDKILRAIELRKKGKTLAQISTELGGHPSRQTILRWIRKFKNKNGEYEAIAYRKMRNVWGEYKRGFKIKVPVRFKIDTLMKQKKVKKRNVKPKKIKIGNFKWKWKHSTK